MDTGCGSSPGAFFQCFAVAGYMATDRIWRDLFATSIPRCLKSADWGSTCPKYFTGIYNIFWRTGDGLRRLFQPELEKIQISYNTSQNFTYYADMLYLYVFILHTHWHKFRLHLQVKSLDGIDAGILVRTWSCSAIGHSCEPKWRHTKGTSKNITSFASGLSILEGCQWLQQVHPRHTQATISAPNSCRKGNSASSWDRHLRSLSHAM